MQCYKNCLSFSSNRKELSSQEPIYGFFSVFKARQTHRWTNSLTSWEGNNFFRTLSGRHLPRWRCLRKIWGKNRAAPLSLLWTAWATARGSWTDSRRDVGGRGDRAGKTGRTQIARPLGKEGRSPAAAAPSLSRSSSRSASWPTSGSDRGPSLSTRRSQLCGKLSPLCPRTNSAKYRP